MKLIPSVIRNLQALSWQGALTVESYQRITLRLYLATAILLLAASGISGLGFLVSLGLVQVAPSVGHGSFYGALGLAGALAFAAVAWLFIINLKLDVLRWRNLGFSTRKVVAIMVVYALLPLALMFSAYKSLFNSNNLSEPAFHISPFSLLVMVAVGALYQYFLYFEATPLGSHKTKAAKAMDTPTRAETIGLFLLQTYVWYGILHAPLDVIFPS